EDVQRDGVRLILLRELQCFGAAHSHKDFESLVAGEIDEHAAIMRVIFHNQQNRVAGLNFMAIVRNLLGWPFRKNGRAWRLRHCNAWHACGASGDGWSGIGDRQIESEGAADRW